MTLNDMYFSLILIAMLAGLIYLLIRHEAEKNKRKEKAFTAKINRQLRERK